MNRRVFLSKLGASPLVALGVIGIASWGSDIVLACEDVDAEGVKTFAYFQGLGPNERRSASRTDGTYSNMPCIANIDIEQGETKTYNFWHGHGGKTHRFTLSEENFASLQKGETVEVFTNVIDGHRHSLRVTPTEICVVG